MSHSKQAWFESASLMKIVSRECGFRVDVAEAVSSRYG